MYPLSGLMLTHPFQAAGFNCYKNKWLTNFLLVTNHDLISLTMTSPSVGCKKMLIQLSFFLVMLDSLFGVSYCQILANAQIEYSNRVFREP